MDKFLNTATRILAPKKTLQILINFTLAQIQKIQKGGKSNETCGNFITTNEELNSGGEEDEDPECRQVIFQHEVCKPI